MTDPTYDHIALVMDRSWSMKKIKESAQDALSEFVAAQKAVPTRATFTFTRFDDEIEIVHELTDLQEVEELKLEPRGNTALLDALGRTIVRVGERLAALPEDQRPGKVIVAVVTDGLENASSEYGHDDVMKLIAEQTETYGWEFVWLAADAAGIQAGLRLGIDHSKTHQWEASNEGVALAANSVSSYVGSYRRTGKGTWGQ